MGAELIFECSFLVPIRRDANLADGALHHLRLWDWLSDELHDRFGGATRAPGHYAGFYTDPDTGQRVDDLSRKYTVAVPENDVGRLRSFLSGICVVFQQKCIYLSVAGKVEFIETP
jgi:hypothetical protein